MSKENLTGKTIVISFNEYQMDLYEYAKSKKNTSAFLRELISQHKRKTETDALLKEKNIEAELEEKAENSSISRETYTKKVKVENEDSDLEDLIDIL